MAFPLRRLEEIIDRSRVAGGIETLLPVGVRPRQLRVRTLLLGMLLTLADHRPAHLTRARQALTGLPEADRARLRVVAAWKHGPHLLTCRQTERTYGLVVTALAKDHPDGGPSADLTGFPGALLEASVPAEHKDATSALAAGWSDLEAFCCPPPAKGEHCADPEASWGHRRGDSPGQKDELFYGYYLQAATMVAEEDEPPVPELARRISLASCRPGPPQAFVPVLQRMAASGVPLGDVPGDSGYAHRAPENWAVPLRAAGASLVQDLHPPRPRPQGHLRRGGHLQRQPVLAATPRPLRGGQPDGVLAEPEPGGHHRPGPVACKGEKVRLAAGDDRAVQRVSPVQISLHRSASNRPNTAGGLACSSRCSSRPAKCRCTVRSEGARPARARRIRVICAAVRPGFSFFSATASSSTSAGVRGVTRAGAGTRASNPPVRQSRAHRRIVCCDTRICCPAGPSWSRPASSRTSAPRWRADSSGSVTSWMSA
jgi:hypothetical protein